MLNDVVSKDLIYGIDNIQNSIFEVEKVPNYIIGDKYDQPDTYTIYKTNGGMPLGTVKDRYFPIQPKVLLDATIDCMIEAKISFDKLQFREYKNGSKISFRFPIGKVNLINMRGIKDETEVYVNVHNGYNGATKVKFYISTYRLICKNGMKVWKSEHIGGFVNAECNQYNAQKFIKNFSKVVEKTSVMQEHYELMNRKKVDDDIVEDFVFKALNLPKKEYADLSTRSKNNYNNAMESIALEFSRTGPTVFGLLNGITHFTNHGKKRNNLDEYLMLDNGVLINDRAQQQAMKLISV